MGKIRAILLNLLIPSFVYAFPPTTMPLKRIEVTSPFGTRVHPIRKKTHHHNGVDLRGSVGDSVYSVMDGVVIFSGPHHGYGVMVAIKEEQRVTRYAHLSESYVRVGSEVRAGDIIGAIGATGTATGPHLHFEELIDGEFVEPTL